MTENERAAREIASRLEGITRDCYLNRTTNGLESEYARWIVAALDAKDREAAALREALDAVIVAATGAAEPKSGGQSRLDKCYRIAFDALARLAARRSS